MRYLKGFLFATLICAAFMSAPVSSYAQAAKIIKGASKVVAKKAASKSASKAAAKAATKTGVIVGTGAAAAAGVANMGNANAASISLNTHTINLTAGGSALLYVSMNNPNHNNWYYNSMNTSVATAQWDSRNNAILIKAINPGNTSIKVQLNGLADYCQVNVSSAYSSSSSDVPWNASTSSVSQQKTNPEPARSVMSLSRHSIEMKEGTTMSIKATVSNPFGYEWTISSSDPSIVNWSWDQQTQSIILTAYRPGSVTLVSSLGDISDVCEITVNPTTTYVSTVSNQAPAATTTEQTTSSSSKLRINHAYWSIKVGSTAQLSVSGYKGVIVWESTSPEIATVSNSGLVKGIRVGSTKIIAYGGGETVECYIDVE